MFCLTTADVDRRILGCADGPASFNAGMSATGGRVVSCDPLYALSTEQIRTRIAETFEDVMAQTLENRELFVWNRIESPRHLGQVRSQAMEDFLADYAGGSNSGRYVAGELPHLPFRKASFDLALSSHFLFLYSRQLSLTFHKRAVAELCRVAREVRVFPLLALDGKPSPHVDAASKHLENLGHHVSIEPTQYEFQRGGNMMMRVRPGA